MKTHALGPFVWLLGFAAATCATHAQTLHQMTCGATSRDQQGRAVCIIGDVDGDCHDDYAVGSPQPFPGHVGPGQVDVYSGKTGTHLYSIAGRTIHSQFGAALAALGDVDGNGVPDFAVGAHFDSTQGAEAGRVSVHSGVSGSLIWERFGSTRDSFGRGLASMPDRDGDGIREVVVGAPIVSGMGGTRYVDVYSGDIGTLLVHHNDPSTNNGQFGIAVMTVADLDNDSMPDLVVSDPVQSRGGFTQNGHVYVFASTRGLSTFSIPTNFALLGRSLAAIGDVTGDGCSDFAAGAPGDSCQNVSAGQVVLIDGANMQIIRTIPGSFAHDEFGTSLAAMPDMNGDGLMELVVGAAQGGTCGGGGSGYVEIIDGATATRLGRVSRGGNGDYFGISVASGGDLDGDGRADFLVGAHQASPGGTMEAGCAYAFRNDVRQLTSPTGGECWLVGTPRTIQWNPANPPAGSVHVELSRNGTSYVTLAANAPDTGTFAWTVTGPLSFDAHVRLSWAGPGALVQRSEAFCIWDLSKPRLVADRIDFGSACGGTQALELDAGSARAGQGYIVLGSFAGHTPGFVLSPNAVLPLNPDPYAFLTLLYPNPAPCQAPLQPYLGSSIGTLDAQGRASACFHVPAASALLSGVRVHHAALILDPSNPDASNPVLLAID